MVNISVKSRNFLSLKRTNSFQHLDLSEKEMQIARLILREISERLGFLN